MISATYLTAIEAGLAKVMAKGNEHGLPEDFVKDVFNAIHEASVEAQNEVISGRISEQM